MLDFRRIALLRKGGQVSRFHKEPWIGNRPTVAEHSFNATNLLYELVEDPRQISSQLVRAMQYHDIAECIIGDVPATTRWVHPELKQTEAAAERFYGLNVSLTEADHDLLKLADSLEGMLSVCEQITWGNHRVADLFTRWSSSLNKLDLEALNPKAAEIVSCVREEFNRAVNFKSSDQSRVLFSVSEDDFWEHYKTLER